MIDPLEAARDAAFCTYGDLVRLDGVVASVNPHTCDDDGAPVGQVGGFSGDAPGLEEACAWLRQRGCRIVRGPIVRHTWYPFRAVTDGFDALPPLTGEPWNAPDLAPVLRARGFEDVAWYVSTWTQPQRQVTNTREYLARLRAEGYEVRAFDPGRVEQELALIHQITCESFSAPFNYMFAPISLEEFRLVVGPGGGGIVPDLFLLCHDRGGDPAGFCYTTREGQYASIKTLVVHPRHRGAGIGSALVALTHARCHELGIGRVIHALMRQGGPSVSISNRGEHEVFRRYVVLERAL